jgi:hypothetical protein
MPPNTWTEVFVTALFVVPGFVYRGIRSRLRGPHPDDQETSVRVLRALGISVALGLVYSVVLGQVVTPGVRDPQSLLESPRETAGLGLLLIFGVPALLAVVGHAVYLRSIGIVDRLRDLRPVHLRPYDNTPTAARSSSSASSPRTTSGSGASPTSTPSRPRIPRAARSTCRPPT